MKKFIIIYFLYLGFAHSQSKTTFDISSNQDSIYFDESLLEKYIDLATATVAPGKIAELKTLVAKKDVELARWSWSETVVAQFNQNESNINSSWTGGPTNNFYPRYLFGLRLDLGTFLLTPLKTKKAKELYNISIVERDYQKTSIATEVTRRYQNYVLKRKSLILRLNAEVKITSLYYALRGSAQNKDYNYIEKEAQIFSTYTQAVEAKNMAEAELRISKTELEQLIGTRLENVK